LSSGIAIVQRDIEALRQETRANIETLRQETRANIEALRQETRANIETLRQETRANIEALKSDLLKWLFGALITQGGLIVALVKLL
jgi:F0F1-type ATP synthase membrane subunit b/b'